MTDLETDKMILELALKTISGKLNDLVAACVSGNGKPMAPDAKVIASVRGYIPAGYSMSFTKVKK